MYLIARQLPSFLRCQLLFPPDKYTGKVAFLDQPMTKDKVKQRLQFKTRKASWHEMLNTFAKIK